MSGCSEVSRDDGADRQRASADTRRRQVPLERKIERGGPIQLNRAIDIIAGNAPRAVSNHFRSSFPDPARAGTAKKDAFRRCVTTMGQRHVRGRLLSVDTTNVRRYKLILPPRQNFWGSCGANNTRSAAEVAPLTRAVWSSR